jgi:glutamate transport system permease protein
MTSVLFDVPGPKARARYRLIGVLTVVGIIALLGFVIWKLWSEDQLTGQKWEPFVTPLYMELLGRALLDTLRAAVFAILGAVVFGVVFGIAKLSDHRIIRWPAWLVVEFFRAVPLLLLIIFIWALAGYPLYTIWPLVAGLVLYNGSVLAEIFRAGINAVPTGQVEAAYALGLRKGMVTRLIQLPQAIRIMVPSLIGQCIVALKDTSLGYAITASGLTVAGRELWNTFGNRLAVAIVLAAIYILLNLLLSWFGRWIEGRINRSPKSAGNAAERTTMDLENRRADSGTTVGGA